MGAPKGNQFWKLASKHGRDKIFATPEIMWEAACEYFQWCIDNPIIDHDCRGKDAIEVELPKMRAFTYEGLSLYLNTNSKYFYQFEEYIQGKDDDISIEFSHILTRIRDTIRNQQYTGSAAGLLKENIVSRYLGLKDKTDVTSDDKAVGAAIVIEHVHSGQPILTEEPKDESQP